MIFIRHICIGFSYLFLPLTFLDVFFELIANANANNLVKFSYPRTDVESLSLIIFVKELINKSLISKFILDLFIFVIHLLWSLIFIFLY